MSENQPQRPARIEALTGLRFLAAMMVFCFHIDVSLKTKCFDGPLGGIAVSFFFVLSGFILTYVYRDRLRWGGLKRFYFTRWARIWPLHAVCLSAVIYFIAYTPPVDYPSLRLASHWLLLQSWIPDRSYVLSYNGVAWSISTEAFFYLMFPLFLLGGLRHFWWKYLLTIAFTACALWGLTQIAAKAEWVGWAAGVNTHHVSHFNPTMRLLEFVSGMAVAYIFMSKWLGSVRFLQIARWPVVLQTSLEIVAILLAAFSYYLLQWLGFYGWVSKGLGLGGEVTYWLLYCGGMPFHAFCIYIFAQSNGWLGRLLSSKLMIFLGEISFAFYMVHRLVILILIGKFWVGSELPYWAIVGSSLLVSLGFSALLFLLIEMPMKNVLLRFYDRKFSSGMKELLGEVARVFGQTPAYVAIAMVVLPLVALDWSKNHRSDHKNLEQVVAASSLQPVAFGDDISLRACDFAPKRMGVQVALVWRADQPTRLRHEYLLTGTPYKRKGSLNLQPGETLQHFFVHNNSWSKGKSFELKLWQKEKLLLQRSASGGEGSTYILSIASENGE
jgi:peptidoglycan/LPS O-acetylase OafA/YrhL